MGWSNEFYKNRLSASGKLYYNVLVKGFDRLQDTIRLPYPRVKAEDVFNTVDAIMLDHPELFWLDPYSGYEVSLNSFWAEISMSSFSTYSEIKTQRYEADCWKKRISSQVPSYLSEYKKLWMLYDYLARQVRYGLSEAKYSQTILGCFKKDIHTSVCEGIAKSFKFLADNIGLKCIIICGTLNNEGHAWNLVECNKKLYHLDVTSELETAKILNKADYVSFLKVSSDMNNYVWNKAVTEHYIR